MNRRPLVPWLRRRGGVISWRFLAADGAIRRRGVQLVVPGSRRRGRDDGEPRHGRRQGRAGHADRGGRQGRRRSLHADQGPVRRRPAGLPGRQGQEAGVRRVGIDDDGVRTGAGQPAARQGPRVLLEQPHRHPCLPGLTCVGNPCVDGGPQTGRCSPACCDGDNAACGKSDPEGISGACDLTLVDSTSKTELFHVCTYRERCKPFQQESCKAGQICLMEDKAGTASCLGGGGKTNRQSCTFANECADGYVCAGAGDAGICPYGVPAAEHGEPVRRGFSRRRAP